MRILHLLNHVDRVGNGIVHVAVDLACMQARAGHEVWVASKGGASTHPSWYFNVKTHPEITVQDGEKVVEMTAREVSGDERARWWDLAVQAYPPYAEYQTKTDRLIPVFVLE